MRLSYSAAAPLLLFLFGWTDCSFAGALGLLRILIYKVCPLSILYASPFCLCSLFLEFSRSRMGLYFAPQSVVCQDCGNNILEICGYWRHFGTSFVRASVIIFKKRRVQATQRFCRGFQCRFGRFVAEYNLRFYVKSIFKWPRLHKTNRKLLSHSSLFLERCPRHF
jgi:hypothetical protein